MTEGSPPGQAKGLASNADKALISPHRQPHRQTRLTSEEINSGYALVNTGSSVGGEIIGRLLTREVRHD